MAAPNAPAKIVRPPRRRRPGGHVRLPPPTLTPAPIVQPASPFGEALYAAMRPWQTPSLHWFDVAIGVMFDEVHNLVTDHGVDGDSGYRAGWSALFDPDLCPAAFLPYLAQYVGVTIPAGTSETAARALIRAESGFSRGTRDAVNRAVERSLTVDPHIDITTQYQVRERQDQSGTADAYLFTIIVNPGQLTPIGDATALRANVDAVKPGGLQYTVAQATGPVWTQASKTWSGVTGTVTWQNLTQGDV